MLMYLSIFKMVVGIENYNNIQINQHSKKRLPYST